MKYYCFRGLSYALSYLKPPKVYKAIMRERRNMYVDPNSTTPTMAIIYTLASGLSKSTDKVMPKVKDIITLTP